MGRIERYKRLGYLAACCLPLIPFLCIFLYNHICNVTGWSITLFHPNITPSSVLCVIFVLLVIVRSDIRMSVGTSDTTVNSFSKTGAHNLNTTNASSLAHLSDSNAENCQFHRHRKMTQPQIYVFDYSILSYLLKQRCFKMNIFYISLSKT